MNHITPTDTSAPRHRDTWLAAAAIMAVGLAAYHNSFYTPFVFDDTLAILENPTIRQLGSWEVLRPPGGQGLTVEGRPLLNLSLALNYAISGTSVLGFHVVNLTIHLGAALALYGFTRLTLCRPVVSDSIRRHAAPLALTIALLWVVHPLQTESVTYIIQRAESLMGLFFLAAFHAFARGADGGGRPWFVAAVLATYCGAATKEVAATIPLLILLYDRAFFAGSFHGAWATRRGIYLALLSTWLLSAVLVGDRGGTFGRVPWGTFALTQLDAIARYVQLSFWPYPLIFDYGVQWRLDAGALLVGGLVLGAILTSTLVALRRWPTWGFIGVWFLAPLSPTSLLPGNRQTIAEHRMYLSLAALIAVAVIAVFYLLRHHRASLRVAVAVLMTGALGTLTIRRNADYRTELALYRDTATKRPGNAFAHYNLANSLAASGAADEAIPAYRAALSLETGMTAAHYNLGNALVAADRSAEAVAAFQAALRLEPSHVNAHFNLGNALIRLDRKPEAKEHLATAARLAPVWVAAHGNLGGVLLELGELAPAQLALERALALNPSDAVVYFNLGQVHRLSGRPDDARRCFERALTLDPAFAAARDWVDRLRPEIGAPTAPRPP